MAADRNTTTSKPQGGEHDLSEPHTLPRSDERAHPRAPESLAPMAMPPELVEPIVSRPSRYGLLTATMSWAVMVVAAGALLAFAVRRPVGVTAAAAPALGAAMDAFIGAPEESLPAGYATAPEPSQFDFLAAAAAADDLERGAVACLPAQLLPGTLDVTISFVDSGEVTQVFVNQPDHAAPSVRDCIEGVFSTIRVSSFDGPQTSVRKVLQVP